LIAHAKDNIIEIESDVNKLDSIAYNLEDSAEAKIDFNLEKLVLFKNVFNADAQVPTTASRKLKASKMRHEENTVDQNQVAMWTVMNSKRQDKDLLKKVMQVLKANMGSEEAEGQATDNSYRNKAKQYFRRSRSPNKVPKIPYQPITPKTPLPTTK
jgi:hypothetical protein